MYVCARDRDRGHYLCARPLQKRKGHEQYRRKQEAIFRALGLGSDTCELLRALKARRDAARRELATTRSRIQALTNRW
eukprot:COSAG01_NODE_3157_length_6489_cov_11.663380_3_plen_78_part_00